VYDGRRAIVGSRVMDQESAESPFVPHIIEDR